MSSEGWRSFLAAQARFHHYSPGNVLLILSQNPHATQVAGFHTWRDLGRFVKKGEHGIAILAPVFPKREKPEPAESEAGAAGPGAPAESRREREGGPVRFVGKIREVPHQLNKHATVGRYCIPRANLVAR